MKKYLIFLCIVVFTTSFKTNTPLILDLDFLPNENQLTIENQLRLEEVIEKTASSPSMYQISLEVFPIENETLNRQRASAIIDYLSEVDVKVDQTIFYSKKEHVPESIKNKSNWNFLRLTLEYQTPPSSVVTTPKKTLEKSKAKACYQPVVQYDDNTVVFKRNSNFSEIKLKSKAGNIVEFEPESFVFEDGTLVTSNIEITIKDATTKSQAILEELTTMTSDGQMLESQGMMYVGATSQGKPLRLAEGKTANMKIKTKAPQTGFQTFNSVRTEEGKIEWFLANNPDIEIKNAGKIYKYYELKELTETELQDLAVERQAIINKWKEKGTSGKFIRQRLRKYRKQTRKRNKYRQYKRKYIERDIEKRQPRITQREVLGETKYHYVEYERQSNRDVEFMYNMRSGSLGWANIDKLLHESSKRPPCDLLVSADEETNVKVLFTEYFGVFNGIPKKGKHVFPSFPKGLNVIIIAAKKLPNGMVKYGYKETTLDNKSIEIDNYVIGDETSFISFVKKYAV